MKTRLYPILSIMLLAATSVAAEPADCRISGAAMHWIADYCMSNLETDDEIPAGFCIDKERRIAFRSECAARQHYKKKMCELAISRGTIQGNLKRCLADRDFVGPTVRNGGVGG